MEQDGLAGELIHAFFRIKRGFVFNGMTQMSDSELAVMRNLRHAGMCNPEKHMRMGDISTLMFTSKPAATQVINKLEKQGLVERYSLNDDRRTVYVKLTAAGYDHFGETHRRAMESVAKLVERFGQGKTRQLIDLLNEAVDITKEIVEQEGERDRHG